MKPLVFIATLFSLTLFLGTEVIAEESDLSLTLSDLTNRFNMLEDEHRELRGLIEDLQSQVADLNQRIGELSTKTQEQASAPAVELESEGTHTLKPPKPLTKPEPLLNETKDPDTLYQEAQTLLEEGDYGGAEGAFAAFLKAHPKHKLSGNAQYWLGVTYAVRGQHEQAAAAFAKGYKNYPKSEKAADNLLRLAKSLAAMNRKNDACTTLEQLASEHPKSHKKEANQERRKLNCP